MRSVLIRLLEKLRERLKLFIQGTKLVLLEEAVGSLELEYIELDTAFLLILIGSLVGVLPIPPLLAADILPLLRDEISLLEDRAYRGSDIIGDLFSAMGGEW